MFFKKSFPPDMTLYFGGYLLIFGEFQRRNTYIKVDIGYLANEMATSSNFAMLVMVYILMYQCTLSGSCSEEGILL